MIIYHANCWDGLCAAWITSRATSDTELVPANYGEPAPVVEGKDVLIVDFSYPRAVLESMHASATSLLVIDHHKTAQKELDGLDYCIFDMNQSGAMLTWNYFHPKTAPWFVSYIQDRDLRKWELPDSRAISAWIGCHPFDLNLFDLWSEMGPVDFIHNGKVVLIRNQQIVDSHVGFAKMISLWVPGVCKCGNDKFYGEEFLCSNCKSVNYVENKYIIPFVNATTLISEIGEALSATHLFSLSWFWNGKFIYSLRSREFDVSVVARAFGGGGHRNAAGFQLEYLLEV